MYLSGRTMSCIYHLFFSGIFQLYRSRRTIRRIYGYTPLCTTLETPRYHGLVAHPLHNRI